MSPAKSVCVVGTGAAGLASLKCCLDAGLAVTAYESSSTIGGLWNIDSSTSSSTISNSSSRLSSFSDFPVPKHWPLFLTRPLVLQYLHQYAQHFHLLSHIQFRCMILKIQKTGDEKFVVTVLDSSNGRTFSRTFDFILLCIGHHSSPRIPVVNNSHKFTGKMLHSKFFEAAETRNKRVVVIGGGNSAGDAAVAAANASAAQVTLAIRSGVHIVRRTTVAGQAIDEMALRRSSKWLLKFIAPVRSVRNGLMAKLNHCFHFSPKHWDLPQVKHGILDKQPMINDLLLPHMLSGRIKTLAIDSVVDYNADQIVFQRSGRRVSVNCDVVVYATGYLETNDLLKSVIGEEEFLYKKIFPSCSPNIGLIGHVQPMGPMFPVVEMQARYFVWRQTEGKKVTKKCIRKSIERDRKESRRKGTDGLTVSWNRYLLCLAEEMGVAVDMKRCFFRDHKLWRRLFFGTMHPLQFRIVGNNSCYSNRDLLLQS